MTISQQKRRRRRQRPTSLIWLVCHRSCWSTDWLIHFFFKSAMCDQRATKNVIKAIKSEHNNRVKTVFVRALPEEQEIEKRLKGIATGPPSDSSGGGLHPPAGSNPMIGGSQVAISPIQRRGASVTWKGELGGVSGCNPSRMLFSRLMGYWSSAYLILNDNS